MDIPPVVVWIVFRLLVAIYHQELERLPLWVARGVGLGLGLGLGAALARGRW